MGCDIHPISQKKVGGEWVTLDFCPFDWRQYVMFGFLAGVRNPNIEPISDPRGLPDGVAAEDDDDEDYWLGDHSYSWLSVKELADFDYDVTIKDPWDRTTDTTYREVLGEDFFSDLATLQEIGADRIVFGFDS